MKYNSIEYWNTRIEPNAYNHVFDYEIKHLGNFLKNESTIEFGCGIGRLYPMYKGVVVGLDFSEIYKDRAIDAANGLNYTHIVHNIHNNPLPFDDNEFKQGIAVKVLLHATDSEAETIIKEPGRVCEEVFIISLKDKVDAYHCFGRNYATMIEGLGFKIKFSAVEIEDGCEQDVIIYTK